MITSTNVKSALVSAVITAILGVAMYILGVGDVFKLDVHTMVNIAALSALTAIVSVIKASLTSPKGKIAGVQIR